MYENFRKDPAKIITVLLFLMLAASCAMMLASRGIYDSCACRTGCSDCSAAGHADAIDLSGYTDVHTKNNLDLVRWAEFACEQGWGRGQSQSAGV